MRGKSPQFLDRCCGYPSLVMNLSASQRLNQLTLKASHLALLAMLLLALAPTLSKVIAHYTGGPDFIQLCTSHGMSWVASASIGDEPSPAGPKQLSATQSCPYCAAQLATFIATGSIQFGQAIYQPLLRLAEPIQAAARLAPQPSPAQARAPPPSNGFV